MQTFRLFSRGSTRDVESSIDVSHGVKARKDILSICTATGIL